MPRVPRPPALDPYLLSLLTASRALPEEARNELGNPSFESAQARILIVRLSPWKDVDRSSAHLFLFSETRAALPGAFIDFAFLPERQDREVLQDREILRDREGQTLPWFYGIASGRSPADFDLVLVSNAFGLELVNLGALLTSSGLPTRASARKGREDLPILILGGSNAAACGPLFDEADDSLVDGLFVGEGEGAVGVLAACLTAPGLARKERLEAAAAKVPGFHPALHPASPPMKARILREAPPPLVRPPLLSSPEAGTTRLQITAGCPGLCSFCFEGWDRRPYRERPLAELIAAARELKRNTGADKLEVYSFNFNTHEEIAALIFELGRIFRRVSLMSQRLDILAHTPGLLRAELAADKRSFTLGIEGISGRLRAWYRKGLSGAELETLLDGLVAKGIRELKLFYIIAGIEEEEDLEEFRAFTLGLAARREKSAPGLRIVVSSGWLVRLPRTPLQHAPLALNPRILDRITRGLEEACAEAGIDFRLAAHFDEYCADQLLSLGSGSLLPWLEACPREGFVYDGSLGREVWPSLEAAARASGLLGPAFLGEKGPDWRPPLAFLDLDSETLHREYLEAKAWKDRQACLGGDCGGCGACPDGQAMAFITGHLTGEASPENVDRITRLTAAKAAFRAVHVDLVLPPGLAGSTPAYKAAWVLRRVLAAGEGSELQVFEARDSGYAEDGAFGLPGGYTGPTSFALYGPRTEAVLGLAQKAGYAPSTLGPDGLPLAPGRLRLSLAIPRREGPGRDEEALEAFRRWLESLSIAATELAAPEGRTFRISPKDLRKDLVLEAGFAWAGDSTRLLLGLGPKARLTAFLDLLGRRGPGTKVEILPG